MPDSNPTPQMDKTGGAPLPKIKIPPGEDIYIAFMESIEKDLLPWNIPLIDEKYKDETPEEKAARLERYNAAYRQYDEEFGAWVSDLQMGVNKYRKEAMRKAEKKAKEEEVVKLGELESQFDIAASRTESPPQT